MIEELDHPRRLGLLGRLGIPPAGKDGVHYPVAGNLARQGSDVAVFEGPPGPEGDLNYLFAVRHPKVLVLVTRGNVDDPEVDLWLDPSGAGSYTVIFWELA